MIHVRSFTFNPFQENTYVVWNDEKECMIVDPGMYDLDERRRFKTFLESEGLTPVMLLNTHCHLDHVFGNAFIAGEYGLMPQIHEKEDQVLEAAAMSAQMYELNYDPSPEGVHFDKEEISLGKEKFRILFVPGHSPGHVAFYHPAAQVLLSGDVLFRESIGRTDLPGGDTETLLESIKTELFALPDETEVFSGHMGLTTIGHEKKFNPFLKGNYQG